MRLELQAVYDGVSIRPVAPERLKAYKQGLQQGAKLSMILEPWQATRSRSQQGLLHEIIGRCARATGYKLDALKMQCKVDLGYYVPAPAILSGDVDPPSYRGQFVDLHDVYPAMHSKGTIAFVRSESSYTKKMEGEFIDYMQFYAIENGVDIDDILEAMKNDTDTV